MAASVVPNASMSRRCGRLIARAIRHGRRQTANTAAAETIRSQATPSGST
jgi:hypothetical protein